MAARRLTKALELRQKYKQPIITKTKAEGPGFTSGVRFFIEISLSRELIRALFSTPSDRKEEFTSCASALKLAREHSSIQTRSLCCLNTPSSFTITTRLLKFATAVQLVRIVDAVFEFHPTPNVTFSNFVSHSHEIDGIPLRVPHFAKR
jgi:hypothetical protein